MNFTIKFEADVALESDYHPNRNEDLQKISDEISLVTLVLQNHLDSNKRMFDTKIIKFNTIKISEVKNV